MKTPLFLQGVTFVFLLHGVDTTFAQVGHKTVSYGDGKGNWSNQDWSSKPPANNNQNTFTPQQLSPQEQQQIQQEAAARAAAEERRRAEEERREAIRLAAVRDKQQGLSAFNEKNWEQAVARLTSALTGLPRDLELQEKLKLARHKLAEEMERRRRNREAFNPYAAVTPNSGLSIPVQENRQIRNINAQSPYGPSSLPLPTQPIKQSRLATSQPTVGIWQRDVPAEQRASRTVILEDKYVGNPNLPGIALNDGKKGYGVPGLPGIYTGGSGSGSGMTPQNEPKLKTEIGDSIGVNHVGNPNLPGIGLNDGKQGYGIPGLPGVYTGGSAPGSGMTPPGEPGLKMKIGDNGTSNPQTTDGNNLTSKRTAAATEAAPVLSAGPAQGEARATSTPGLSPTLTPQTAAQPITALQQQANASQAAAAAPALEDASFKARAGFGTPLGTRETQPAAAISVRTATPGTDTKAGDQLMSVVANGQNSAKNFDTGGKYAGSLNTPGGAGTGYSDPSVVDLQEKKGIVDPSVLKGNLSAPIFSAPGKPLDTTTSGSAKPAKNFYQIGAGYTEPITSTTVEPPSHFQGALDKKLARFQGTLDAMFAAGSSYNPDKHPPGYSILQRFTLARNGTEATLYGKVRADRKPTNLILAFRGTSDQNDWTYGNVPNGAAKWLPSSQGSQGYVSSVLIARLVQKEFPDSPITLAGHSLGGGEATLASVATGLPAITFNAAGVNPSDYGYSAKSDTSQITNYHLSAEPLTTAQNNLTVAGSKANQSTRVLPIALGNQIAVTPVGLSLSKETIKKYFETVGWHGMGAVEPAIINYLSQQ
jgi:hypothetical protein